MAGQMWFGNKRYMQWVPCPESGASYGAQGAMQSMDYLNGGAFRRRSATAAKTRRMSWSLTSRDRLRGITDFADGIYGDGPIYWTDPMTMDKNVLSPSFAAPSLTARDGVPLVNGSRPTIVPTGGELNGYPIDSAVYSISAGQSARKEYIPIPPGHTAWVGAHGDPMSTGGIAVNYVLNGNSQPKVGDVLITSCTSPRFSASYPAGTFSGIELSLAGDTEPVTNLFTNPSFEAEPTGVVVPETVIYRNDLNNPVATGWTATLVAANGSGSTGASATITGVAGTRTLRISTTGPAIVVNPTASVSGKITLATVPGVQYTLAYQMKTVGLDVRVRASLGSTQGAWITDNALAPQPALVFVATSTSTDLLVEAEDNPATVNGSRTTVYAEIADITVTQASYVGPATVEVQRNSSPNPNAVGAVGFSSNNGTTWTVARNVAVPAGNPQGISTGASSQIVAGVSNTHAMSMYNLDSMGNAAPARTVGAWFYVNAEGYQANIGGADPIPLSANTWTWIIGPGAGTSGYTAAAVSKVSGSAAEADVAYVTGVTALLAGAPLATIAGGVSYPDLDLVSAWLGTPNASESALNGMAVPGVSPVGCVAIQSTRWKRSGTYSMRLIPTSASNNVSYVTINIPEPASAMGTAVATGHQEAPLAGSTWTHRGRPYVTAPQQSADSAMPDEAGEMEHRWTFSGLGVTHVLLLPHGGMQGSGDVWWDCVGLFEGDYTGPWFDGSSPGASWSGTPNASTSTLATRSATIAGIMVQVLPDGQTPEQNGPFISGQGLSGAAWEELPSISAYSVGLDLVGMSAVFTEVEQWL